MKVQDIMTSDVQCCGPGTNLAAAVTGLMERHEKMAWMLRAMLEGGSK